MHLYCYNLWHGQILFFLCNTSNVTEYIHVKANYLPFFCRISYSGRGLKYGDCGLKILNVDSTSHGTWTCHISSGRTRKATLKSEVKLSVLAISTDPIIAESVGIVGGLLIILTVSGGFIFYKYADKIKCYRRKQKRESSSNNESTETENSNLESEVVNADIEN